MRSFLALGMLTLLAHGARADAPPSETDELVAVYTLPLGASALALSAGGAAFGLAIVGGAVAGAAASQPLSSVVPAFAPPGDRGTAANMFTGAVMGAVLVSPLALAMAIGVDTLAWLVVAAPASPRQGLVLLAAQALVLAFTLPAMVMAAVICAAVTAGARWQQDKLASHEDRKVMLWALGAGFTVAFLAVPMALCGALLRTAAWVVWGDDGKAPPHQWFQRLRQRL